MKGGSIYLQGNRWIYKGITYIENGKKKRDRKSFATEEEAQHYRDCIIRDLNLKVKRDQPKLTVAEAYKKWRLITWQNEDYYTYNSQRGYESVFNKHILPCIGDKYVDNLDSHNLYMHLKAEAETGKTQKTIDNIVQALKVLLNFAEENEWIITNNANKIRKPTAKNRDRDRIVNIIANSEFEQVYEYLKKTQSHYAEILRFLRYSGLRVEELCIKEEDISSTSILIRRACKRKKDVITGKSKLVVSKILKSKAAYRRIPLTKELKSCLEDFETLKKKKNIISDYVFCSTNGSLLEQRNILRAFHTALNHCNLEERGLHSLRKLCCKTFFDTLEDWEIVRRIFGHESSDVTQRYYYFLSVDDFKKYAAQLDQKLDQNANKSK